MKLRNLKHLLCAILTGGTMLFTSCEECNHEGDRSIASSLQVGDVVCSDGSVLSKEKFSSSKKEPVAIVYHVNRNPENQSFGLCRFHPGCRIGSLCRQSGCRTGNVSFIGEGRR